ncbi:MAG: arginine repressor [Oscillospiraceae bacterium]|nr:arginine repressor [Oscillospiraceae bacterium]
MGTKRERQSALLRVVTSTDIDTQYQLIDELKKMGIESTQATMSRDIRELNLIKELTPSGLHKYTVSDRPDTHNYKSRLRSIFKESVISYANAQNIVVIKTLPGLAPAACGAIDSMAIQNIVGSIAGDDTGFLAMEDITSAERFCEEIEEMLK